MARSKLQALICYRLSESKKPFHAIEHYRMYWIHNSIDAKD